MHHLQTVAKQILGMRARIPDRTNKKEQKGVLATKINRRH